MDDFATLRDNFREKILSDPEAILDDREVMEALVAAGGDTLGQNIVDLRGIAMGRLETRLERLEDTHRSVIAAAYDNLAGTNQVHRASLRLLEARDFQDFLDILPAEIAGMLNIDQIRLVLETDDADTLGPVQDQFENVLTIVERGFVERYLTAGQSRPTRPVTLRQVATSETKIYGQDADWVRSEACLRLDLGPGRLPGLLALASEDPHKFRPTHGTDLLAFFGGVFERTLRIWLA